MKSAAEEALEQKIKTQLDAGRSIDAIIADLANSLSSSLTSTGSIPAATPSAFVARVTEAFKEALNAGESPPGASNADRALALVNRFQQVAEAATRVVNEAKTGSAVRLTATGQSLDADEAGADPTPDTSTLDQTMRSAYKALAGTDTAVTTTDPSAADSATVSAAVAAAAPTASAADTRTVAMGENAAVSAEGSTLLGRTVARAYFADPAKPPQSAAPMQNHSADDVAPATPAKPATTTVPTTVAAVPTLAPKAPMTASTAGTAIDEYLKAFSAALEVVEAHAAPAKAETDALDDVTTTTAAPTAAANDAATAATAAAMPFAIVADHTAPTPTAKPTSSTVDNDAIIEQVLTSMSVRSTADGTSTVRMRLHPEDLGDVSIKLTVSGGVVDAALTAHSADAQTALAGGQAQLAKTLADSGLKLQSFSVGLAGGGAGTTGGDTSRNPNARQNPVSPRLGAVTGLTETSDDDPLSLLAIPSFGPSVYTANPKLGALNYLV